jgi:antitoxin CptB
LEKVADMTGTTRSSAGLDDRRKRLLFRCWHRGTREMDLILGGFADMHIGDLSDQDIEELENLLEVPDPDLYRLQRRRAARRRTGDRHLHAHPALRR